MKKIYMIVALAMVSVWSFAASIGAPASIEFGTRNIYGQEELMDSVDLVLSPSGISDWGIGVEVLDDEEGIFWTSDTWLYSNGTPDWHGEEPAKVYFYVIEEGVYTATLRLSDYNSAYDESTGIYANHADVALSVTVVNNAPVFTSFVKVTSVAQLAAGDVVIFVSESANAVCGPLNGAYLSAVTADVTIANGKASVPETAQMFTLSKNSGDWQFTTTDTGQRLHLDITGKGAFTYGATQPGAILANWGISISGGNAEISKPDGSFPVEFNVDRFKPYKSAGSGTSIAIYKKEAQDPTGLEDVASKIESKKVLRDGQILIIRNGALYDMNGRQVKK